MRNATIALAGVRGRGQHPGLLLHRYLSEPAGDSTEKRASEKLTLLAAAVAAARDPDLRALYRAAFDRWSVTLPADPPPVDLVTAGRLIVGLGTENVLETGIRLHHTYGLPIVPGSALKGLAAHYCNEVWGQRTLGDAAPDESTRFRRPAKESNEAYRKYLKGEGPKPADNYHRLLFGTNDDSGCVAFHDAWIVPDSPNSLVPDVMTPHHPEWLDGKKPPTDFDSPVPVAFLSVAGTFRVAVSWNGPPSPQARNWTELALALLKDALKEWGAGGKTSSGYGRLIDPKEVPKPVAGAPAGGSTTRAPAGPPAKRNSSTPVRVKIVGPRPRGGFDVQEAGRPQGTLTVGSPPSGAATDPGAEVDVLVHVDDPAKPQYRWPAPPKK